MTREEIVRGLKAGNVLYQDARRRAPVEEEAFMSYLVRQGYVDVDLVQDRYGRVLRRFQWKRRKPEWKYEG